MNFWYCSSRKRNPVVGEECWVVSAHSHVLPEGLNDREQVKVLKIKARTLRIVVQNQDGASFELPPQNVDAGMEYLVNGNWLKESDTFVQDALQRELEDLPRTCRPHLLPDLPAAIKERGWRLQRWAKAA